MGMWVRFCVLMFAIAGWTSSARAGMPSPIRFLNELGQRRFEELSFFFVGFLAMAGVVRVLWNSLRRDFPQLPEISYRRSASLLLLWGLFLTVVLAMVSGARELMTPGAWKPKGITYQLADSERHQSAAATSNSVQDAERRLRLENLRFALWQFAQSHEGRFPTDVEKLQISKSLWLADDKSELTYFYQPGLSTHDANSVLVYEPEMYEDGQYVILTSGAIVKRSDVSIPSSATSPTDKAVPVEDAPNSLKRSDRGETN